LNDSYSNTDPTVPENNQTYAGGKVKDAKLEFTLAKNSEIVVVSAGNLTSLEDDGFSVDSSAAISASRYMNLPGPEDVFYNDYVLGKKAEDYLGGVKRDENGNITNFSYFYNYDLTSKWVNVAKIQGFGTYKDYRNAYDSGKLNLNSFSADKVPTCEDVIVGGKYYDFLNTYIRVYDDVGTEGEKVTLNLGSFEGAVPRTVVIIRPITPGPYITNFSYDGPKSFEDLPYEYRVDCVDDSENKAVLNDYAPTSDYKVLATTLKEGERAYIEGGYTITDINSQLGIEGAYIIPPHRRADIAISSLGNYAWIKAYYHSMKKIDSLQYPNFPQTPQPWYSFDLNRSSMLYLITLDSKPAFLDDTWQKLILDKPAFTVEETGKVYRNVYVKPVDVENGTSVKINMKTYSSGDYNDGVYFLVVKPL